MPKLFVMGAAGMLGERVSATARLSGLKVIALDRKFADFGCDSLDLLDSRFTSIGAARGDYVVNCIGWIPQKTSGSTSNDVVEAVLSNVVVPAKLNRVCENLGMTLIQIATDCVFDGRAGNYSEDSGADANDLYGRTKILGETIRANQITVRCSIVGISSNGSGLINWFTSQEKGSEIEGYANHLWNGVTTNAFSKLVVGIVKNEIRDSFLQHWIPLDSLSKFDLLKLAQRYSGRIDIRIKESETFAPRDMTLATLRPEQNSELWRLAGYGKVPVLEELVAEMFESGDE